MHSLNTKLSHIKIAEYIIQNAATAKIKVKGHTFKGGNSKLFVSPSEKRLIVKEKNLFT